MCNTSLKLAITLTYSARPVGGKHASINQPSCPAWALATDRLQDRHSVLFQLLAGWNRQWRQSVKWSFLNISKLEQRSYFSLNFTLLVLYLMQCVKICKCPFSESTWDSDFLDARFSDSRPIVCNDIPRQCSLWGLLGYVGNVNSVISWTNI